MRRQLVSVLVIFAFIYLAFLPQVSRDFENQFYDAKASLFARRINPDVVLVEIDQESLDFYRANFNLSYPWPRGDLYGRAVAFLKRAGARLIAIDMIFSEPYLYQEQDEILAEAVSKAANVLFPFLLNHDKNARAGVERFALKGDFPPKLVEFSGATASIPMLSKAQRAGGNVMVAPGHDGIYRSIPAFYRYRGVVYPSFSLAMGLLWNPGLDFGRLPLSGSGNLNLRFYREGSFKSFSISQVIQAQVRFEEGKPPGVDEAAFRGKAVIIGASAPGLLDLRPTPVKKNSGGFEIWATALQNLIRGEYVRDCPDGLQWLIAFLLVALVTLLLNGIRFRAWHWEIEFFLLLLLLALAFDLAFFGLFYWNIHYLPLAMAVILPSAYDVYYRNHMLRQERKKLKTAFELHMSKALLDKILQNPQALALGGEKKLLTIFFSDLAGFTSLSEKMTPEEVVSLLNAYLERMTAIIFDQEGYVDKFEGDAIMAFWGAPIAIEGQASKAMRAALLCQQEMEKLNAEFAAKGLPELSMRIGLNSGEVIVGNIGSSKKINYTVIGDSVNLASRLEGINKQYGTRIICGSLAGNLDSGGTVLRRLDLVRVKGKSKPEDIFEVVGQAAEVSEEKQENIREFERALKIYFAGDFQAAGAIFASWPDDPPSRVFSGRCRFLLDHPPDRWDGTWTFTEK